MLTRENAGLLRELAKNNDSWKWNPEAIIQMVDQNCREDNTINHFLSSREPSWVVDNMKISELLAIENGPQQFDFVSPVVSFGRHTYEEQSINEPRCHFSTRPLLQLSKSARRSLKSSRSTTIAVVKTASHWACTYR
jgi:hypothetical protein